MPIMMRHGMAWMAAITSYHFNVYENVAQWMPGMGVLSCPQTPADSTLPWTLRQVANIEKNKMAQNSPKFVQHFNHPTCKKPSNVCFQCCKLFETSLNHFSLRHRAAGGQLCLVYGYIYQWQPLSLIGVISMHPKTVRRLLKQSKWGVEWTGLRQVAKKVNSQGAPTKKKFTQGADWAA